MCNKKKREKEMMNLSDLLLGVTRWRSSTTAILGILDVYFVTSLLQIAPYNRKQSLYIHARKREREKNRKEIEYGCSHYARVRSYKRYIQ